MISGKVTTKKQLNAIISDASELDGVVSIGGTVVGASLSQRGVTGAKGDKGDTGERGETGLQGEQGEQGDTGNGIASTVLNGDYTLTITFTDGTS